VDGISIELWTWSYNPRLASNPKLPNSSIRQVCPQLWTLPNHKQSRVQEFFIYRTKNTFVG